MYDSNFKGCYCKIHIHILTHRSLTLVLVWLKEYLSRIHFPISYGSVMHCVFHLLNRRQHLILDCWCYWLNHAYTQVEFSTLVLDAWCWPILFTTSLLCLCVNKKRQRKQEGGQGVIANFVTGKCLLISAWWSSYEPVMMKLPPCIHRIHSPESTYIDTEMNVSKLLSRSGLKVKLLKWQKHGMWLNSENLSSSS